jgi:hypothetical protein
MPNTAAQDIAYVKNYLQTNLDAITGADLVIDALRKKHGNDAANEVAAFWAAIKPKEEPRR